MILTGDKKSFELKIVSYQFPYIKNDEYDSNWLNIKIKVKGLQRAWEATDPMLLTFEVTQLVEWLEGILNNKKKDKLEFLEPNLKFVKIKKSDDKAHIRIYFELEARPKWAHSNIAGQEDLYLDLNPTRENTRKAIANLKNQLKKFPIRGKIKN